MNARIVVAIAAAALLGGCGAGAQQTAYVPTDCLHRAPFSEHPGTIGISCDGNRELVGIHWTDWGSPSAKATGTLVVAGPCDPDCVSAAAYRYPVRITATDIATCISGQRVYGLVTADLPQPNATGSRSLALRLESCDAP